ncbi:MAG TPA: dihydrolipoamide acetyltransferase family protein [Candidatus Limnocylindrales bacterium]|nr:dihydrolipoamide acetyltransferase family protein [Candidatus Limnocylindrales bacterium]
MPKVQMPQLGESVAEGTIGKWLKKPGDHVDKYEPIVEVITDKVNAEVPSPFEGTLTEILVQEGETVPNNTDIAVIEGAGEAAEATEQAPPAEAAAAPAAPTAEAPVAAAEASADETAPLGGGNGPAGSDERPERSIEQPTAQPAAAQATTAVAAPPTISGSNGASGPNGYKGPTTPAVRRLAREHGVDLAMVAGSGHSGRVTRDDVLKFVESGGANAAAQAPAQAPAQAAQTQTPAQTPAAAQAPAAAQPSAPSPVAQGDSLKQASPMRKAIAAQMTKALQVPVAYTTIEVDMSGVVALRNSNKGSYQAQEGISLTFDAFVAKATVDALKRHSDFNAHYTDEGHWRRQAINLGVAVAVEDGLVVPVIKDADRLSIHGLNRALRDLADRARSGKLKLDDIQGGTFTLDNTGWTGSMITQPIINAPEVGILTMESIVKRPVVVETATGDAIGIKPMMYMCLGFDHRATDGAQAGRFVADVRKWLEAVDSNTAIW